MKRHYLIYTILGLSLLTFLVLFSISEKQKRSYEEYLSSELSSQIADISQATLYNLGTLKDVIEEGRLTEASAGELEYCFHDIAYVTQDVSGMGLQLGILKESLDEVVSINADYAEFFMKLKFDGDEIVLTEEQISTLKMMEKLMQEYVKVVKETLLYTGEIGENYVLSGFSDYYTAEKGITDDYWIKLLKGFQRVTNSSYSLY
ncbi:hypothetical protein [Sutcliffiella halmapala]|uniref:hypothetical protein n=1 Tax=Sutcliffiella halmapala TaxID=79882 RepID=UPI00099590FB|nr:hypothetical protein [Sutcliffiella halmapala]